LAKTVVMFNEDCSSKLIMVRAMSEI